jgi:hypothetical protein
MNDISFYPLHQGKESERHGLGWNQSHLFYRWVCGERKHHMAYSNSFPVSSIPSSTQVLNAHLRLWPYIRCVLMEWYCSHKLPCGGFNIFLFTTWCNYSQTWGLRMRIFSDFNTAFLVFFPVCVTQAKINQRRCRCKKILLSLKIYNNNINKQRYLQKREKMGWNEMLWGKGVYIDCLNDSETGSRFMLWWHTQYF